MAQLLEFRDLSVDYPVRTGFFRAVNGVSLRIRKGEAMALVGESGSGKTTLVLAALSLLPRARRQGMAILCGQDLLRMPMRQRRNVLGAQVGLVLQNPYDAFDPVYRIGDQIAQALSAHLRLTKRELRRRVDTLLDAVELDAGRISKLYPHELSGGMLQRAQLALALCCEPELLIADEPTSALDVVVQAQILDLLCGLRRNRGLTLLMITHDLGVVAALADSACVMRAGRIVEHGPVERVLVRPEDPYTVELLQSDAAYRWEVFA